MKMRIALLSDIHIEHGSNFPGTPDADVAVLAGDIGTFTDGHYVKKMVSDLNEEVRTVYIPGNHEYYGGRYEDICAESEVKVIRKDEVSFVATTLWSNPPHDNREMINDFAFIKGHFTPQKMRDLHLVQRDMLKMVIDHEVHDGRKVVVVTHHLPSFKCIHPQYANDQSGMNNYFASPTLEMIWERNWEGKVVAWLFGHTHKQVDIVERNCGVRLVANPHGNFGREQRNIDPQWKVIEV